MDRSTAIRNLSGDEITGLWLQETTWHPARGTISYIRLYWLNEIRRIKDLVITLVANESMAGIPRQDNAITKNVRTR